MSEASAPAPARPPAPTEAKRKAGRPPGAKPAPALTETELAVEITPEDRALLAEWAAVKGTTPEALVQGEIDHLLANVAAYVTDYRPARAEFDREAAARIEAAHQK